MLVYFWFWFNQLQNSLIKSQTCNQVPYLPYLSMHSLPPRFEKDFPL